MKTQITIRTGYLTKEMRSMKTTCQEREAVLNLAKTNMRIYLDATGRQVTYIHSNGGHTGLTTQDLTMWEDLVDDAIDNIL
jgi:hypothetical protein